MVLRHLFITFLISVNFISSIGVHAQNTAENFNVMTSQLIKPPYLKPGDTVAIVAPSGILKSREGEIQQAIEILNNWGLNAKLGNNVFNKADHFAGTDEERCEDLQNALDDPSISAIWCARGGYGTVRILDRLDYTKFKTNPKWLIGYSDITALHNQIHNEGVESLHALMCVSLTKDLTEIQETLSTFKAALFGNPTNYVLDGTKLSKVENIFKKLWAKKFMNFMYLQNSSFCF